MVRFGFLNFKMLVKGFWLGFFCYNYWLRFGLRFLPFFHFYDRRGDFKLKGEGEGPFVLKSNVKLK